MWVGTRCRRGTALGVTVVRLTGDARPSCRTAGDGDAKGTGHLVRTRRQDPVIRLWLTRLVRNVLPLLFGARITDANIPFKLLRRRIWEDARPLIPPDTLAPSLFLAVFAASRGFDVAYLPVPHRERQTGTVSIRRWRLLKFCARAFRQLVAFRVRVRG